MAFPSISFDEPDAGSSTKGFLLRNPRKDGKRDRKILSGREEMRAGMLLQLDVDQADRESENIPT